MKEEVPSDFEDDNTLALRQRSQRTDRPRSRKPLSRMRQIKDIKCKKILNDLVSAMKPLRRAVSRQDSHNQSYWFFGRHVTERLNALSPQNSESAARDILNLIECWPLQNQIKTAAVD